MHLKPGVVFDFLGTDVQSMQYFQRGNMKWIKPYLLFAFTNKIVAIRIHAQIKNKHTFAKKTPLCHYF
jgi:hypothetical protein